MDFLPFSVSSATIRNEMSDLSEKGYLHQPHTSAGRIPSAKAYRLYVNALMEKKEREVNLILLSLSINSKYGNLNTEDST